MGDKKSNQRKVKKVSLFKRDNKKERRVTDLEGNVINIDKPKKEKKFNKLKKHISKYKKTYSIICLTILAILIVLGIYIGVRNYILYKKYGIYENTMNKYGFSLLYNNESPKSSEQVTRIEMIKLVIAAVYNIGEVESKGFIPKGAFEDDEWAELAIAFGIIDEKYITKDTYNKEATHMETLMALLNARSVVLDIPVSSTKESNFKNMNSYTIEQKQYINDAAGNSLIENSSKKINLDKDIFKGELNKLIVTFVEKYNTIVSEGETLVLKEDSKPKNAEIYPYILYSVGKEVYEYEPIYGISPEYKTPAETYKYKKEYYSQVEYRSELYYNTILNVDYSTIDKNEFYNKASEYLRYDYSDEINSYVDYIIENKIKIEGKAEVQFPIFYLDGLRYRARMKLTFKIVNSDTDKNILLGDLERADEVTYKKKEYTVYIDAPMGTTYYGKTLLLDMEPIIDMMVNDKEASKLNEI